MKQKILSLLPKIGAALVLLATIVELTLERSLKELHEDALRMRLEDKIDTIWHLMAAQYSQSAANKTWPIESIDFATASRHFWYQQDFHELNTQQHWFETARAWAQVLGGAFILVGIFRKKETDAPELK
jgi:hypothetical protein